VELSPSRCTASSHPCPVRACSRHHFHRAGRPHSILLPLAGHRRSAEVQQSQLSRCRPSDGAVPPPPLSSIAEDDCAATPDRAEATLSTLVHRLRRLHVTGEDAVFLPLRCPLSSYASKPWSIVERHLVTVLHSRGDGAAPWGPRERACSGRRTVDHEILGRPECDAGVAMGRLVLRPALCTSRPSRSVPCCFKSVLNF
jgi:hypothetical protein